MDPQEILKNKRLIQFSDLREAVLSNAVKNVPAVEKAKEERLRSKTLLEFH